MVHCLFRFDLMAPQSCTLSATFFLLSCFQLARSGFNEALYMVTRVAVFLSLPNARTPIVSWFWLCWFSGIGGARIHPFRVEPVLEWISYFILKKSTKHQTSVKINFNFKELQISKVTVIKPGDNHPLYAHVHCTSSGFGLEGYLIMVHGSTWINTSRKSSYFEDSFSVVNAFGWLRNDDIDKTCFHVLILPAKPTLMVNLQR